MIHTLLLATTPFTLTAVAVIPSAPHQELNRVSAPLKPVIGSAPCTAEIRNSGFHTAISSQRTNQNLEWHTYHNEPRCPEQHPDYTDQRNSSPREA